MERGRNQENKRFSIPESSLTFLFLKKINSIDIVSKKYLS